MDFKMVVHKRGNKIREQLVFTKIESMLGTSQQSISPINSHTFRRHISIESMLNASQQSISPINSHTFRRHISIERGLN